MRVHSTNLFYLAGDFTLLALAKHDAYLVSNLFKRSVYDASSFMAHQSWIYTLCKWVLVCTNWHCTRTMLVWPSVSFLKVRIFPGLWYILIKQNIAIISNVLLSYFYFLFFMGNQRICAYDKYPFLIWSP